MPLIARVVLWLVTPAALAASACAYAAGTPDQAEADIRAVLAVRAELVSMIRAAVEHHAALERALNQVRASAHPTSLRIAERRDVLAATRRSRSRGGRAGRRGRVTPAPALPARLRTVDEPR